MKHVYANEDNNLLKRKPDLGAEWDVERNYPDSPINVTAYSNEKAWWKCSRGHSWLAIIKNRSYGQNCPYCRGKIKYIRRMI